MNIRDRKRHRARATTLLTHAKAYDHAQARLHQIHHAGGQTPQRYLIRRALVRARTPAADRPVVASPAAALAPMKGWALHLYLIAIFEAQARLTPAFAVNNDRPLLYGTRQAAAWVDLLPTITDTVPRSAGMRRQLVRALALLHREHLVGLRSRIGARGRYERFELRHEDGESWSPVYTIPRGDSTSASEPLWIRPPGPVAGRTAVVALPATFFLNGWAHVLSAAEITTYLMLCDLEARYPQARAGGVYLTDPQREAWYGIHRDVYATHRQLSAFGLIERLDDPDRRPDGTITRGAGQQMRQPYRFRTLPQGFSQPARITVAHHLTEHQ
ncbi:hypothetical protein [Actinoplanes derwentensis]|uniref:Uncharacterized protein n=1 Tax=Actinoplanes derwentensis TaxID=113562 RepID=A0A1H2CUX3_9ACTN|nr:hypothetical protein [Actinoplanes derwentensis]GID81978.1 hypothetical protein Ade03nite_09020 [Actinoplanes derwentensis]SDT74261.1 hypothetical protein SAMN04489716_6926 [Actinoplanes derwentensis]